MNLKAEEPRGLFFRPSNPARVEPGLVVRNLAEHFLDDGAD
jgi:hypothetical protein